ncbi:T9SS type A sorting domain-containing protein [Paracrocinitomix mangrovi]|uniref:T9SS type A sorting domain-containing protein n=1 Tax=Paracrocinitomix mangrovi TaxID=2862509 RepID=UPI001C8EC8D5|nr:T9SS type A sorting domain-containing protein [Paracrocinitomix mangrovi]UKN01261.1 T9SS type A sorting domain-containing protein [Paracrocinitomix mangrovi]
MKKIILSMLLLVAGNQIKAQSYESVFSDTTSQWNIVRAAACDLFCYGDYKVTDTVLFDTTYYFKLNTSGGMFFDNPIYVREDSTSGKVWYYDYQFSQAEYLTMDLSLGVGDTFVYYSSPTIAYDAIVDTVYYVNGKKHVQIGALINICGTVFDTIVFIEGTGTTAGFAFQNSSSDLSNINEYLLCHSKDSVNVYAETYFNGACQLCMLGLQENQFEFEVFPNPANDLLNIKLSAQEQYDVELFDVSGKTVLTNNNLSGNQILSLNELKSGSYLIQITLQNGSKSIKKFVKQ